MEVSGEPSAHVSLPRTVTPPLSRLVAPASLSHSQFSLHVMWSFRPGAHKMLYSLKSLCFTRTLVSVVGGLLSQGGLCTCPSSVSGSFSRVVLVSFCFTEAGVRVCPFLSMTVLPPPPSLVFSSPRRTPRCLLAGFLRFSPHFWVLLCLSLPVLSPVVCLTVGRLSGRASLPVPR